MFAHLRNIPRSRLFVLLALTLFSLIFFFLKLVTLVVRLCYGKQANRMRAIQWLVSHKCTVCTQCTLPSVFVVLWCPAPSSVVALSFLDGIHSTYRASQVKCERVAISCVHSTVTNLLKPPSLRITVSPLLLQHSLYSHFPVSFAVSGARL